MGLNLRKKINQIITTLIHDRYFIYDNKVFFLIEDKNNASIYYALFYTEQEAYKGIKEFKDNLESFRSYKDIAKLDVIDTIHLLDI